MTVSAAPNPQTVKELETNHAGSAHSANALDPQEHVTVRSAQERLHNAGLYDGKIDGKWNLQTKKAIRTYQKKHHLKVTGVLDQETLHSLHVPGEASSK